VPSARHIAEQTGPPLKTMSRAARHLLGLTTNHSMTTSYKGLSAAATMDEDINPLRLGANNDGLLISSSMVDCRAAGDTAVTAMLNNQRMGASGSANCRVQCPAAGQASCSWLARRLLPLKF
jgi:hypothetical protein